MDSKRAATSGAAAQEEQNQEHGNGDADQPEKNPAQLARFTRAFHVGFHKGCWLVDEEKPSSPRYRKPLRD